MSIIQPPIIGLTGGIGSGKSAAAERFAQQGITVIDTDSISHALTAPDGKAIPAIHAAFGPGMITPDQALDRTAMRERVFSDPEARHTLESILHPMIRSESLRQYALAKSSYVILAVPLLLESGSYQDQCQRICVVDCPEALQITRVSTRSGLTEPQIRAIMATQISRAARLAAADDIIDNSGTLPMLHQQVDRLHARYLALSR